MDIDTLYIDNYIPTVDEIGWEVNMIWRHRLGRGGGVGYEIRPYTGIFGGGS